MAFDGRIEAFFTIPASTTISVTTNGGGPDTVTLPDGTYTLSTFLAQLATNLDSQRPVTAGAWSASLSTGASGTGKVTIAVNAGTYSIAWTSTNARDLLGFTADITSQATSTGASQARGLWIPDCPCTLDGALLSAPKKPDTRSTEGPTGFVISHVGNTKYQHNNLGYSLVAANRTWIASETTTNESFEKFLQDTQNGLGHAFFTPRSKCVVYAHTGSQIGNGSVAGWYLIGCDSMEECVTRADEGYDGLWRIKIPRLVTPS